MGTIGNAIKNSNSTRIEIGDALNALEDLIAETNNYYASIVGGSGNAITLTCSPALSSYAAPIMVHFIAGADSTGNVTVNVDGLGAQNVYSSITNEALVGGEIKSGVGYSIKHNGTRFYLYNPQFSFSKVPFFTGTSGGTANTQTLTTGRNLQSYTDGETWLFKASVSNTLALTINRDALGTKDVYSSSTLAALTGGEVIINKLYFITYNAALGVFVLLNPSQIKVAFTPSVLTPTAGTVTGGSKSGSQIVDGKLVIFEMGFSGYTQNSSTSTYYIVDLPTSGAIVNQPVSCIDRSTGASVPCWLISSTQIRINVTKTATSAVNLNIAGSYLLT